MGKQRIAILGGGAGALFAALAITHDADWSDRFELTVHQLGWRLGGKGASSRDADNHWRNTEHGLHILGGFYHNSFRWLRSCYDEWRIVDPAGAIAFDAAFISQRDFVITERDVDGWRAIDIVFLANRRQPGVDPVDPSPIAFLRLLGDFILSTVRNWSSKRNADTLVVVGMELAELIDWLEAALDDFQAAIGVGSTKNLAPDLAADALAVALSAIRHTCLAADPRRSDSSRDPDPVMLVAIAAIIGTGLLRDRVWRLGYDAIEDENLDQWSRRHGATDRVIASPYSRAGYDYVFGYAGGVTSPPAYSLSAGVAMRWFSRILLTSHGAPFWHMDGGMGEIVFVPLYRVLAQRGVRFEFFHRIRHLGLSDDARTIDRIELTVQSRPLAETYAPLVPLPGHNRATWPARPQYDLLEAGVQLAGWCDNLEDAWAPERPTEAPLTLTRGTDFDLVVLGISVGALANICGDLVDRLPRWRIMLSAARTVAAAGVQIWSPVPTAALGWIGPKPGIVTAFAQPFATWADMSFLLRFETPSPARHLAYVCGPLVFAQPADDTPGSSFPTEQAIVLRQLFTAWATTHIGALLPLATPAYGSDVVLRANVSPSDHYVLSPPGNRRTRFHASGSGVENLFLAGDWTRTGLDAGSFESAVMSGLQCAAAVTGRFIPIHGGDDA